MKKNINLINHFYRNSLLVMIFGLQTIQGMIEEPPISEEEPPIYIVQPEKVVRVDTTQFLRFCLNNAIRQLARNDIVTQESTDRLFPNQDRENKKDTIARLLLNMNLPTNFRFNQNLTGDQAILRYSTAYTNTYDFLNLSLYPLEKLKRPQKKFPQTAIAHIVTKKTQITQSGSFLFKISSIGVEGGKNVLIYYATQVELNGVVSDAKRLENITVDRILLQKIKFNNIAKIQDTIKINDTPFSSSDQITTLALLQDQDGQTLLHILCENLNSTDDIVVFGFTEKDKKTWIRTLLRFGADPNIPNSLGYTPLHILCNKNVMDLDKELILSLLQRSNEYKLKKQADPNVQDNDGNSLLHILCKKIHTIPMAKQEERQVLLDIIKILFDNKKGLLYNTDPNLQDTDGNTPLHIVCENASATNDYNKDIFELLLENNANPNIKNKNKNTVLHTIGLNKNLDQNTQLSMMGMIFKRYDSKIINLIDQNTEKLTPFFIACAKNHTKLALQLLEKSQESNQNNFFQTDENGNHVWLRDSDNATSLHSAVTNGNLEIVQAILNELQQKVPDKLATFIDLQDAVLKKSAAHYAIVPFWKILDAVLKFNTKYLKKNTTVEETEKALKTILAIEKNKESIEQAKSNFIKALFEALKNITFSEENIIKNARRFIEHYQTQFIDARDIYNILQQNGADLSLVDNQGQTPQAIFDKYAPVVATALSIIAEKLGMKEEATQLKELISPIPAQSTKTEEEEKEEKVVVVEQIQEKQSQTFWQKYKTIFGISSILAISVPILYKLYRKYRKQ